MIRVTIEKVEEIDQVAEVYEDQETGDHYTSKYDIPDTLPREEVWRKCKQVKVKTGKKIQESKSVYEQTISAENESVVIENIIKATNGIE